MFVLPANGWCALRYQPARDGQPESILEEPLVGWYVEVRADGPTLPEPILNWMTAAEAPWLKSPNGLVMAPGHCIYPTYDEWLEAVRSGKEE